MENHRELLSKLKFISKIQPLEKLSMAALNIQTDSIFTTIWRTIFQDGNRNKTLAFISDTIYKAFEVIRDYSGSKRISEITIINSIVEDLRNCKQGLHNIKETYVSDRKFCCDIDVIIELIDANLLELKQENGTKPPSLIIPPQIKKLNIIEDKK